ncbi:hypothetical protein BGX28_008980 [Mortierella sp. GBA30]|nr:hypothetical protein BGX28_008980 [Mortierella sp. GBA30]
MFVKSAALAVLALVASVSAQNHTSFTNPVQDGLSYAAGSKQPFSWNMACVAPSTFTSPTPTNVTVVLVDSTNSNGAFYLQDVATIDCTKSSGNAEWTVPTTYDTTNKLYSLKIVLSQDVYSSRFTITGTTKTSPSAAPPATTTKPSSGAKVMAPLFSGVAAAAAAAIYLL